MQLRIKALYGQTVSHIITILWVMEVIAVVALGVASLVAIDVHPVVLQTSKMCNPTYLPPYAFLFWVPVIVFETFLFSLALRIAYRNYQEIGNWRGAALLHIVLRDNFNFFVCAFVAYIVTATTWLTANPRYFTVPGSFSCALTAIMGCRLILNLCEAYHHPRYPEMTPPESIWAATSGVRFESGSAGGDGGVTTRSSRARVSASLGTWSRWPTREWRSGNGNGNGNVLSHGSMGGRGVGNATELCVTVTSAEGSGSSTTMTTTAATKKKNACDGLLEEGVYEMHALEVLELRSVAGHSAADGEDDVESVGVAAR
ncbi:hypothetical protein M413DRAFT_440878 [Hebeloma cylindrosporum]|uniref:Uncharacterized protein n=1 Tax=Hebeloma cylindrosporum TaxID=76867 RepID=A0A0C2YY02_HEBCY|nr:hypothetical protein M413DRAFT_440878 [Hebeloma cylindrosporum h7]